MNLRRWLSPMLLTGLILAATPLIALAHPPHEPYGWHGRHYKHYRHHHKHYRGQKHHVYHIYETPPAVTYVTPINPYIGMPYNQPYYSPPPGLSGTIQYNF